jgi:ribosome-associated protein
MGQSAEEGKESRVLTPDQAVMVAAQVASDRKATELVLLDLREVASFTDYFLLCTGASGRQVQAVADAIEKRLSESGKRPLHTEGYSNAEWILLDYGDFLVHVFSTAARRFYDLERLWRDAKRVEIADEQKS